MQLQVQQAGKKNAYIVQCQSELSYHIEERWLYEDISDFLNLVIVSTEI